MRILVVDLSSIARKFFELDKDGRLSDGNAFSASLNHITRARDGFDRLVIARDMRPSFRHFVCPTYKQGRENPGAVYTKLESDLVERLWKDGAKIFPNKTEAADPQFEIKPGGFPEADDIIASIASWYADCHSEEWELVIASEDSDLAALVDDETKISMRRLDGAIWNEADVLAKFKCKPSEICDLKTIGGDKGDGYQPFPHPSIEGGPGIGPTTALKLLATWGRYDEAGTPDASRVARVMLAAENGLKYEQDNPGKGPPPGSMPDSHERRCLLAGGRAAMTMAFECARMLDQLPLGFERILKEPEVRPIVAIEPTATPLPLAEVKPVSTETKTPVAMVLSEAQAITRTRRDRNQIERYALQPRNDAAAIAVSKEIFNTRLFPQYDSWQSVFVAIAQGNEHGVAMITSLDQGYVVHGRLARSAAYLVGLVKKSGKCKALTILSVTEQQCTGAYRSTDDEYGPHFLDMSKCPRVKDGVCQCPHVWTFTIEDAMKAGWARSKPGKEEKKWITEPKTMLPWAWYRMSCRRGWPEITGGIVTRAELTRDPMAIATEGEELLFDESAVS